MSRGVPVKTPERVAEAQRLRDEGLLMREIGERFGIGAKVVSGWLQDPDGRRQARRHAASAERCAGTCEGCGIPTSGSRGRKNAPRWCPACVSRKVWTRDRVIEAIRAWAVEYGEPPAATDWSAAHPRRLGDEARARRFE